MKILSKRRTIFYLLWGALLYSNLVLLFLVLGDFIKYKPSSNPGGLGLYAPIFFAIIAGIASLMMYIRTTNPDRIREMLRDLVLELPKTPNQTQKQREEFEKLPEIDKKKMLIERRSLGLLAITWFLSEVISIAGIIVLFQLGEKDYFFYFSVTAILILLKNFPKTFFSVVDEVVR